MSVHLINLSHHPVAWPAGQIMLTYKFACSDTAFQKAGCLPCCVSHKYITITWCSCMPLLWSCLLQRAQRSSIPQSKIGLRVMKMERGESTILWPNEASAMEQTPKSLGHRLKHFAQQKSFNFVAVCCLLFKIAATQGITCPYTCRHGELRLEVYLFAWLLAYDILGKLFWELNTALAP